MGANGNTMGISYIITGYAQIVFLGSRDSSRTSHAGLKLGKVGKIIETSAIALSGSMSSQGQSNHYL